MRKKFIEGLKFTLALVFWVWVGYIFMFAPKARPDPPTRHPSPEAAALNLCSPLVALEGNMELSIFGTLDEPMPKVKIEDVKRDSKGHRIKSITPKIILEFPAKIEGRHFFVFSKNRWIDYTIYKKKFNICVLKSPESGDLPSIFIGSEL